MKFENKMLKLGLALSLTAAFGLSACGDSNSSSPSNGSEEKEDISGAAADKYNNAMEDYVKAVTSLGICTEKMDGETKDVTVDGKTFTMTCSDGIWGSEKLDEYMQELKGEMLKDMLENTEVDGCDFKIDDKKWSYTVTQKFDDYTQSMSYSLEPNEDKLVEIASITLDGIEANLSCTMLEKIIQAENKDNDEYEVTSSCKDGVLKLTSKGVDEYYDDAYDRVEEFNGFMGECQMLSGNASWKPIKDEDYYGNDIIESEDDESSSSEKPGSSSSEKPSSSSSSEDDSDEGYSSSSVETEDYSSSSEEGPACSFSKEDDEWNVGDELTYIFDKENGTVTMLSKTDLESAENCKQMLGMMMDDGVSGYSCEGSVFVIKNVNNVGDIDFYKNLYYTGYCEE